MIGFSTPYKGVSYQTPKVVDSYEKGRMFNYLHYLLENVIERYFDVRKTCWPILKQLIPFLFETQMLVLVAPMIIHNFSYKKIQLFIKSFDLRRKMRIT